MSTPSFPLRAPLAWAAASLAGSAFGAGAFVGLAVLYGLDDPRLAAMLWAGFALAGTLITLIPGGVIALAATAAGRRLRAPRPLADMGFAALAALAILMGVRAWIFIAGDLDSPYSLPGLGPVLAIPLLAGALAGYVYWRLAGKPRPGPRA